MVKTTRLVPCGQAAHSPDPVLSWSPDHERQLTFRSQKTDDLIIIIVDQRQQNQETYGQNPSQVLTGGSALRTPARIRRNI